MSNTSGSKSRRTVYWLCITALFMALNIAMSSFSIPVPGGHLYMNDIVICTAAILLDPLAAFMVGGVGAFLGDLFFYRFHAPRVLLGLGVGAFLGDLFFYPTPMFVSLVTHGLQAVVISIFSH
ncbi:MAG: ECF transporter S component, partial [Eubacteriales bacterium]|nr:ECF transporter S component [Eubacteriales bacterium]